MASRSRFRLSHVTAAAALVFGLAVPLALTAPAAQAQDWRHGGWHGGGWGDHDGWRDHDGGWRGGDRGYYGPGPGAAIATGILGLAVGAAVGSVFAPPTVYAAPPPTYYQAPPVIYAAPPPVYYAPPPPPVYYPPQG